MFMFTTTCQTFTGGSSAVSPHSEGLREAEAVVRYGLLMSGISLGVLHHDTQKLFFTWIHDCGQVSVVWSQSTPLLCSVFMHPTGKQTFTVPHIKS